MMNNIVTYTDTQQWVGRYLEQVGATDIAVIEELRDFGVVWRGRDGTQKARAFGAADLWSLRARARLVRGAGPEVPQLSRPSMAGTLTERLRVLGAIVDA